MKIPLLDLSRQYETIKEEINRAVLDVLAGGRYILGENVKRLEQEVAAYTGVPHAVGVANGSDALYLALLALGIGPGDEVIVPAFTFFAIAGAVAHTGAIPVFADIKPDSYNIDPLDVEKKITGRTRAFLIFFLKRNVKRIYNELSW
ncbi:MAG: aminotransferase class I/II-fold pyridoxal phosphate-dependent enzyme [Firmicutes bacterium]|nr:aminotransferase class I/II-fold pyridoxal phosphate-dependent enzyme [Bacillota bacterium]